MKQAGCEILDVSGVWQSPSWPPEKIAPDYINACLQIECRHDALSLLTILHEIEAKLGRVRSEVNAPRCLDLDLLDFRGEILTTPAIHIPHPRMMKRGFVLFPLSQIAPNWRHPATKEGIEAAISRLPLKDTAPMQYLGRPAF